MARGEAMLVQKSRPSTAASRLVLVAAAASGLLAAASASADPRWWWHDQRLTFNATDSVTPHVVVPGYATGGANANGIFVTWAEVDPAGGDLEIWMTASFN